MIGAGRDRAPLVREGQRDGGSTANRVYRNLRTAGVLGLFAAIVLALILSSALSASTPLRRSDADAARISHEISQLAASAGRAAPSA